VEVDFDWTVLGQIVLFLVLLFVLKPMLFEPMLQLFEERERRIDGARKKARDIDNVSAGALAKYEAAMDKARAEGNKEREKLRSEGVTQANALLSMVRMETVSKMEDGRKNAQEELARVRTGLRQELPKMARDLASRVIGREVA
jgi:F-type H+-transporting ATPase subunit b